MTSNFGRAKKTAGENFKMSQQKTFKMKIVRKLCIINENLIKLIRQRGASRKLSTFAMKSHSHCKENEIRSNITIKISLYLLILFYYQQEGNTEKLFRRPSSLMQLFYHGARLWFSPLLYEQHHSTDGYAACAARFSCVLLQQPLSFASDHVTQIFLESSTNSPLRRKSLGKMSRCLLETDPT